jgi:hypothetical protein
MSTTTAPASIASTFMFLDMEQTDRLIHALQAAKRAARRDAANYGHEGVDARVLITAETITESNSSRARLRVETMESYITAFGIDDIDGE